MPSSTGTERCSKFATLQMIREGTFSDWTSQVSDTSAKPLNRDNVFRTIANSKKLIDQVYLASRIDALSKMNTVGRSSNVSSVMFNNWLM